MLSEHWISISGSWNEYMNLEFKHSLFKGTTIYNGEGIMEVAKVGMATMMGEMAADMADEEVDSPLKVKLSLAL